jgi:2-polyprenyl-3-methyl-5-hydroxy-6-metoxy-1,4-benzoquinol methylase
MVKSPITHSEDVTLIKELETQKVVDLYKNELSIDVSNEIGSFSKIEIWECNISKLRFYANFDKIAGKDDFYCNLAKSNTGYYNPHKWEFEAVLKYFNKDSKVLEIGSGNGYFIDKLKSNSINDITGIELSSDAVKYCRNQGHNVIQGLIEDHYEEKLYDIICSFQIFEHLPNVDSVLKKSTKILIKGGLMIISVPNNKSLIFSLNPFHTLNLPPHHVMLWDEISLIEIANIYNLQVVEIIKSKATISEKSIIYKSVLINTFGKLIGNFLHKFTRFFMKRILPKLDGHTIICIYKKVN